MRLLIALFLFTGCGLLDPPSDTSEAEADTLCAWVKYIDPETGEAIPVRVCAD